MRNKIPRNRARKTTCGFEKWRLNQFVMSSIV